VRKIRRAADGVQLHAAGQLPCNSEVIDALAPLAIRSNDGAEDALVASRGKSPRAFKLLGCVADGDAVSAAIAPGSRPRCGTDEGRPSVGLNCARKP